MSPLQMGLIVAALMMTGALAGASLRKRLSERHFDEETKDVVKLGLGFLATLSALVMGLVISSSKASYDTRNEMVHNAAALIVQLDASLRQIGPAADQVRRAARQDVAATIDQIWPTAGGAAEVPNAEATKNRVGGIQKMLFDLPVTNEQQRAAQANALKAVADLAQINAVSFTQRGSGVIAPLLSVVACWMMLNIAGWNLFAPHNRMVVAVNVVCSLSVASAIFLILELDQPFNGVIRISDAPMRAAHLKLLEQ